MNNLTNQEDAVVRADFIVCSPDDDLENCLCKRLQRELESLREQLRWRTDWENIPNGIPFEIKYYDGRIFIGYDEMGHIEYFKKRGFGWREIPELPEVNHES